MATVSPEFLPELLGSYSGVTPLVLMTLQHPDMTEPGRLVLNTSDIWSRGQQYIASYFRPQFPLDSGDELASVSLEIDNVSRQIELTIQGIQSPPTVTLEVVTDRNPDRVEIGPYDFKMQNVTRDALQVTGELSYEDILNKTFPAGDYNPAEFPGLFA